MALKFKFVSSGQAVDDAVTISQVINGESIKPLAPVNIKGTRNTAGDLLIEWTGRSRLAPGMIPRTDVPLAEEQELYELEIYSGSTVLRTIRIGGSEAVSPQWTHGQGLSFSNDATVAADGSIQQQTFGNADDFQSLQTIRGDFLFDTTTDLTNTRAPASVYLLSNPFLRPAQWPNPIWQPDISGSFATGALVFDGFTGTGVSVATGDRLAVRVVGSQAAVYKNYVGAHSSPLWVSAVTVPYPLLIYVTLRGQNQTGDGKQNVLKPRLQRVNFGDYLYLASLQTTDFGSTQASLKVRVYKVSAVIGRGSFTEAVI